MAGAASADHHDKSVAAKPKLIVAISVDQLSSDLFSEYRSTFTGGLKRLTDGVVFPSGYQSHAATETCPGHATIMTGAHAGRAGIIGNNWVDLGIEREDKTVYCAEDERIKGTSFGDITRPSTANYIPSAWHLLVPTLGERLKKISPESRNVAVAGKDRAALMMGGKNVDEIYWFKGKGFETDRGKKILPGVAMVNAGIAEKIDLAREPTAIPLHCAARNRAITHGDGKSVGTYAFGRPAGAGKLFRLSPDFDAAIVAAAIVAAKDMKLGQGEATDILSVGLSATDYIGHAFGTEGLEMCLQMAELDRNLGKLFNYLDAFGIDYAVMLTADHGGLDLPERARMQAMPYAERLNAGLNAKAYGAKVKAALSLTMDDQLLYADGPLGDYYISRDLDPQTKARVKAEAIKQISAHPQVQTVLDGAMLAAMPMPTGAVEEWTLAERARASFHPDRSGDFIVILKNGVTPIPNTVRGYVATHGSPWDYDRRVPILFWRKGMDGFEQPHPVKTVDIAPTLGALIGVEIPASEIDGRCLDLDAGIGNSCD
ncbi:Alkaline phosphatase [hydrothermal vent metagenome]|uniref:Alkaline phosphatase n=1 Tax=hydrothermal vent metagenome TaxID=652676 RepID=A0A3B0SHE4_9ZZZZ